MVNYFNKEERKVFSEALTKNFPFDALKVVRQKGTYPIDVKGDEVSIDEYFDSLRHYDPCSDHTLFLKGRNDWILVVDFDKRNNVVTFSYISKNDKEFTSAIYDCEFCFEPLDFFERIRNLFICRRYEYRLARYLYKIAKRTNERLLRENNNRNLENLKKGLFSL